MISSEWKGNKSDAGDVGQFQGNAVMPQRKADTAGKQYMDAMNHIRLYLTAQIIQRICLKLYVCTAWNA